MIITQAEFQANVPKYLRIAESEDVTIYPDDTRAFKLSLDSKTNQKVQRTEEENKKWVESLVGIIPDNITLEEAREERLSRL